MVISQVPTRHMPPFIPSSISLALRPSKVEGKEQEAGGDQGSRCSLQLCHSFAG